MEEISGNPERRFGEAAGFWEPRRIWYNCVLFVVALLWLALTWPHFRPALTLEALGKMAVLAFLANVCYCAAYLVEFFVQSLPSDRGRRRFRLGSLDSGDAAGVGGRELLDRGRNLPGLQSEGRGCDAGSRRDVSRSHRGGEQYEFSCAAGGNGVPCGQPGNICGDRGGGDFLVRAQTPTGASRRVCDLRGNDCVSCDAARFFGGESRNSARAWAGKIFL